MNWRREPALIIGVLQALLSVVVGFGLDWLNAEQAALWISVINVALGAVAAWRVRPIAPVAFTTVVTTVVALLAAYGLNVSQEMVGSINTLVVAVLMLLTRAQVSPQEDAPVTGVLGDPVVTDGRQLSPPR